MSSIVEDAYSNTGRMRLLGYEISSFQVVW